MTHPWIKWAEVPTPELVSRLNTITCEVMSRCDVDSTQEERDEITDEWLTYIMSEAHWISEELEHRINLTEHAGRLDIMVRDTISDPLNPDHPFREKESS